MSNDTVGRTLLVALLLCGICSVLVSVAAVGLRPQQERNRILEVRRNILRAAGFGSELAAGQPVKELFKHIEVKLVDLKTGKYVDRDPADYSERAAAEDPKRSIALTPAQDKAGIKRRAKLAPVYLVKQDGKLQRIILPVYGKGLWSTMYGFLALEPDTITVANLIFYEDAETPGLGGEIENPKWQAKWHGKQWMDADGQPKLDVIKGAVDPDNPRAKYQIDGLSGATLTSRGVENLMRFWAGENGFGPYLARLRSGAADAAPRS